MAELDAVHFLNPFAEGDVSMMVFGSRTSA
jgi:hypothetical protein